MQEPLHQMLMALRKNLRPKKLEGFRVRVPVLRAFRALLRATNAEAAIGSVDKGDLVGAAMLAFIQMSDKKRTEAIRAVEKWSDEDLLKDPFVAKLLTILESDQQSE